jgi:N-acetylmuramoyl-L-alanine amidase CwlA
MKLCKTKEEYINYVAPFARKACKRYGYLPSVLIAQSVLENGAGVPAFFDNPGVADLVKYNNMVGIKVGLLAESWADKTVWPGGVLNKDTPETYGNKSVTINDNFRTYDNVEQSFADYLLFMKYGAYTKGGTPKYGDAVLGIKDYKTLIRRVHELGYATGKTYSDHVIKIIEDEDLTRFDDLTGVTPTIYTPGYRKPAQKKVIKLPAMKITNITARNKSEVPHKRWSDPKEHDYDVKFIVVHYLGVPNADNPDLYGGGYGGHYNVERNGQIFKAADPKTDVIWHCGGELQGSGGHTFFKICTNYNSIGVECGVCYTEKVKEGDGDSNKWYFTEETQKSLVQLVSSLMDEYKISEDHVIRHYDVTGKICPNPYVKNNGLKTSWTWSEFKNNLKQYRKDGTITIPDRSSGGVIGEAAEKVKEAAKSYLQKGDSGDAVKTMQKMLIECGYSCGAAGADGQFGSGTLKAVELFQKTAGLTVDGLYGIRSRAALETAYKAVMAAEKTEKKTDAASVFLKAVKAVADKAKKEGWHYGDSHATPPCSDKTISCDRIVARALWDLGYTDQRRGGITCNDMPTYLHEHGFIGTTKKSEIKAGAVVAVGQTLDNIEHVFVVESYNAKTDMCRKYDTGSDARIKHGAYYTNVKLCEWSNRKFLAAWNVPAGLKGQTKPKPSPAPAPAPSGTVWNGVDYKPVYNYTYYRKKYPDLRKAFGTDKAAYFKHFCEHGMHECRKASSNFDVKKYRTKYEDLQKAFGNDWPKYYEHYCVHGKFENRKAK